MKLMILVPHISTHFMENRLKNVSVTGSCLLHSYNSVIFVFQVGYLTQFGYLSEPSQDANNLILDDGEALKNAIETLQVN